MSGLFDGRLLYCGVVLFNVGLYCSHNLGREGGVRIRREDGGKGGGKG